MTDLDRLLSNFIDAWNAGQRPSANHYLDQVDAAADRSELASQITAFLDVAPIPARKAESPGDAQHERIVQAAGVAFDSSAAGWQTLMPRWRAAAGMSIGQLASRVLDSAGLKDADPAKAAGYLSAMENGSLDSGRVSGRAMTVIARALGVNADDVVRAGQPMRPAAASLLFRLDDGRQAPGLAETLEALSDVLLAPGQPDAVDAFFLVDE